MGWRSAGKCLFAWPLKFCLSVFVIFFFKKGVGVLGAFYAPNQAFKVLKVMVNKRYVLSSCICYKEASLKTNAM